MSRHRTLALLILGYLAVYLAWVVAMAVEPARRGSLNDILVLPFYLGAALGAFAAGRMPGLEPRFVRGWRLVALAWAVSALGSALWTILPDTSWADGIAGVAYNLYYPFLLLGLALLLSLPAERRARLRLGLEGLIVAVATATLAWYFVFRHEAAAESLPWLLKRILVLCLGELLAVVGATALLYRLAGRSDFGAVRWLAIGTFAAALGDFVYEHAFLTGAVLGNVAADGILAVSATLVALAGASRPGGPTAAGQVPAVDVGLASLPYLGVGTVGLLLAGETLGRGSASGTVQGLVISGTLLSGLVIWRLVVAQREVSAEAAQRAAQDIRFRQLVDRSSDALVVLDDAGVIRFASPALERLVAAGADAVVGRSFAEFMEPESRRDFRDLLQGRAAGQLHRWRVGRGETWRDVEAVAVDLTDDPIVAGIVLNVRDVSERLRLEVELRQAQKLEAVGRLAGSVAHDFNNILAVVLGNVRLLALTSRRLEDAEERQAIERAVERGAALVRQLLALARPSPGKIATRDLNAIVVEVSSTLRTLLPTSIEIGTELAGDPLPIKVDEAQFEQVVLNLALNARDAMPRGGRLTLRADVAAVRPGDRLFERGVAPGRWARLVLADTGLGMDRATLERAFEPFFTTKPPEQGTGLGLSTVRRFVEEADGRVLIDSEPNRGTAVTVLLPLTRPVARAERPEPVPARSGQGRLLVVEDEPSLRRALTRFLERSGYSVLQAEDGTQALDRLREVDWDVDLVLTDMVMPKMGGEELVQRMRKEKPDLPVLCMSGHHELDASRRQALWTTAQFIAKPAAPEDIAARIDSMIGGVGPTAGAAVS
jgi:PAS domain S-box-containing protein